MTSLAFTNKSVITSSTLLVDSRHRDSSDVKTASSYVVKFPAIDEVVALTFVSSEIPNTEWNVPSTQSRVDFTYSGTDYSITLTSGTYTAADLADELTTKMNTAVGSSVFTVAYSSVTKKFTVTSSAAAFSLLFATGTYASTSARIQLGFSAADTASATTATSDLVVNLLGTEYVLICARNLGRVISSGASSDILAKIVFDVPPANVAYNTYVTDTVRFNPPLPHLDKLEIRVQKPDGTLYDFNGFDHSFSLRVWHLTEPREFRGTKVIGSTINTPGVGRGIDEGVFN